MFVIEGLRIKFGVRNAGALLSKMGFDFGLSVNGHRLRSRILVRDDAGGAVGRLGAEQARHANNMDNIYFGLNNGIPNPAINPADWMSFALIGGAAVMALLQQ